MNKPVVKWYIGPVKTSGLDCLRQSVLQFAKVYPEFERVICFNQIDDSKLESIPAYKINQAIFVKFFNRKPLSGYQVHWKLYPGCIASLRHEITIDNDIVIDRRVPEIDEFLKGNKPLVYEGRHRLFGMFDKNVPKGLKINSGIYGVPPAFDFNRGIAEILQEREWQGKFDEQGAVASVLTQNDYILIPQCRIPIVEYDEPYVRTTHNCGMHFVGLNYVDYHRGWSEYLSIC